MKSLKVTVTKSGNLKLLTDYVNRLGLLTFIVPKGFITDGASIPWFLQFVGTPYEGDTLFGAIIHDNLYQNRGRFKIGREIVKIPRRNVDYVFYRLLRIDRVNALKAGIYYAAVRLVGWYPWYFGKHPKKLSTYTMTLKTVL